MKTKKLVLGSIFIALGLIIPIIFHQFNMGGPVFLPMHIPVLFAGLFLGPIYGLIVGVLTPILSSVLTGMPPLFPMLPIMIFELGIYGLVSGYLSDRFKGTIVPLITSMIVGRIVAGMVVFVLVTLFGAKMDPILFVKGAIIAGLPGIIIQLILIPVVMRLVRKNLIVDL